LQQHRFARARRRYDQPALSFADRREQIHDAAGKAVARLRAEVAVNRKDASGPCRCIRDRL
jgi:hypothetical protein